MRYRFGNHETARRIVNKRGEVKFSYAPIDFIRGRNQIERVGASAYRFGSRETLDAEAIDRGIAIHFRGPVMVAPDTAPAVVERLIRTTRAFCRVKDRERWRAGQCPT